MSDTEEHDDLNGEPDWEKICKSVQVGDQFYWDCAARKEELEMIEEIRNEPPFEERLMQRAQDIPLPPGAAKLARVAAADLAQAGAPKASSGGLAGLIEELATGPSGKYVLAGGAIAMLGLWFMFRSKKDAQDAPAAGEAGVDVIAHGVGLKVGGKTVIGWFSTPQLVNEVRGLLQQAGVRGAEGLKPKKAPSKLVDTLTPAQFVQQVQQLLSRAA